MRTKLSAWPDGTADFVPHNILKDYIQHVSKSSGVHESTVYRARVTSLVKSEEKWHLQYSHFNPEQGSVATVPAQTFDAVVVASGHYHAPRIPFLPGLKEMRDLWPSRVWHSKSYRTAERLRDKTVLLIGGGTSSTDIARELGPVARKIYQSTRNGLFDFPATLLPENGTRIGEIASFEVTQQSSDILELAQSDALPITTVLKSGQKLCGIDYVIVSTGYHLSLPFLKQLHDDHMPVDQASENILVTDGTQIHNLHKDIFYIPDPSLMFVGIPYFSATFTLFEFQAIAVAAMLSGKATLPSERIMRDDYEERVKRKGYGKPFHSIRGEEEIYVSELVEWVNAEGALRGLPLVEGHTPEWHIAKKEQSERIQALFGGFDRGDTVPEPVLLSAC